ncbi:hydrogenase iron-sulfur subunit [Desulfococcaceae bacterium HSG7]|nr:hydrogenase iron-sulfur subunit [Desulfococcaceae bacterium HSG7]
MINKTLIFGSGPSAYLIAEKLILEDSEIIIAAHGSITDIPAALEKTEILNNADLIACRGAIGAFAFTFDQNGKTLMREATYAVIAEEGERYPNFDEYGLNHGERIIALSAFKTALTDADNQSEPFSGISTIAFLTGLGKESDPVILEEIMDSCLRLKSACPHIRSYILTKNLKVGGAGLELKYRQTKEAGAIYMKFTHTHPEIQPAENGCVITFTDEITGDRCRITPDMAVVDERFKPSPYAKQLARVMELETDALGFAQSDNVHRYIVATNRKGIVTAGPARIFQTPADYISDSDNAALTITSLKTRMKSPLPDDSALINNRCTQCLTCLRVCPFHAIQIQAGGKLNVAPQACECCGLCTAECPEHAITLKGCSAAEITAQIRSDVPLEEDVFTPHLVAFCCERSAKQAAAMALAMNMPLPSGLRIIAVPCAGIIGLEYILSAFQAQADGVLVLTCHQGNCHSGCGNISAHDKAFQASAFLQTVGFEKERLKVKTLAANMGHDFATIVNDFEKQISNLGPSGLKR